MISVYIENYSDIFLEQGWHLGACGQTEEAYVRLSAFNFPDMLRENQGVMLTAVAQKYRQAVQHRAYRTVISGRNSHSSTTRQLQENYRV